MKITFLLFEGVTALDVVGPFESLVRIADNEIILAAKDAGRIQTGDGCLRLYADACLADVSKADVLIVPGGHPDGLRATMSDANVRTGFGRLTRR